MLKSCDIKNFVDEQTAIRGGTGGCTLNISLRIVVVDLENP